MNYSTWREERDADEEPMSTGLIAAHVDEPSLQPICHGMWSVTPYARCDIRCHYCCTQVQGDSVATVEPVADLAARILALPPEDTVILGAFSDAYPNAEAQRGVTRPGPCSSTTSVKTPSSSNSTGVPLICSTPPII